MPQLPLSTLEMLSYNALLGPIPLAVFVLCLAILNLIHRIHRKSLSLPPGPPAESWIFGNSLPTS
jgi:hypothetical protein